MGRRLAGELRTVAALQGGGDAATLPLQQPSVRSRLKGLTGSAVTLGYIFQSVLPWMVKGMPRDPEVIPPPFLLPLAMLLFWSVCKGLIEGHTKEFSVMVCLMMEP